LLITYHPIFYTFFVTLPAKPHPIVSPQSVKGYERASQQASKPKIMVSMQRFALRVSSFLSL
jgi:hypothetical protein